VLVMDHLGRTIAIPTIFCSHWKVVLDSLIGVRWLAHMFHFRVPRGMIRSQDNRVIEHSKFASTAGSGAKFEISIVMRQTKRFTGTCPRCGNYNYGVATKCGWIKWQVVLNSCMLMANIVNCSRRCSKQFE